MDQAFYFNAKMTHTFLKYAESVHFSNQKVQSLIDDLRKGLSEVEKLHQQGQMEKMSSSIRKNVKLCSCIMLHVQCLADISDDSALYDRFINGWSNIVAS